MLRRLLAWLVSTRYGCVHPATACELVRVLSVGVAQMQCKCGARVLTVCDLSWYAAREQPERVDVQAYGGLGNAFHDASDGAGRSTASDRRNRIGHAPNGGR